MGFDMNIKHVYIKRNIESLLSQIFSSVLYQNHLEGYKFRPQGCNIQVITLRKNEITDAHALCMVSLKFQSLAVTTYMSVYNFKALKYGSNRGNIKIKIKIKI
jgi:hypothetical protein